MHVEVTLTPQELERTPREDKTVVVIDVLRATTTIVTALESGAAGVLPVGEVEEARNLVASWPEAIPEGLALPGLALDETGRPLAPLLAGERNALPPEGFDLGNSPLDFTPDRVQGRAIVLTTSNGTQALEKARGAGQVQVACLRNARAVARILWEEGRDVILACSGTLGRVSLEDAACAARIMELMEVFREGIQWGDGATLVRGWYAGWRTGAGGWPGAAAGEGGQSPGPACPDPGSPEDSVKGSEGLPGGPFVRLVRSTRHGQRLLSLGLDADLAYCAQLDVSQEVPRLEKGWLVSGAGQEFPGQSRS